MPIFKMPTFKTMLILFETTAKLLQLCLTLCDPTDSSPPGFSVSGQDSPGKNTGAGCLFLLTTAPPGKTQNMSYVCVCVCVCVCVLSHSVMSDSLGSHGL